MIEDWTNLKIMRYPYVTNKWSGNTFLLYWMLGIKLVRQHFVADTILNREWPMIYTKIIKRYNL